MRLTDFTQPTPLVIQALAEVLPGRALDIGSFEGRNALYLARKGWDVVAIDTDKVALAALRKIAEAERLPITMILSDVRNYASSISFDVILSLMVFHFLPEGSVSPVISKVQEWTKPGGMNIITAFTADNEPGTRPYLFPANSLRGYYKAWDIQHYEEAYSSGVFVEGKTEPEQYRVARLVAKHTN